VAKSQTPEDNEVTTMSDLMGNTRDVIVDNITEVQEVPGPQSDTLIIRMNTTLDDFTYGNPNVHYKLEAGKRYKMPRHIAQYLDGLGYVWH
jgi:hypothetical protein